MLNFESLEAALQIVFFYTANVKIQHGGRPPSLIFKLLITSILLQLE